jgi:hypothetical protein
MDIDGARMVAEFLAKDYPFNLHVTLGACPVCFKYGKIKTIQSPRVSSLDSPTSRDNAYSRRIELWMELFESKGLDPIQCLNAYIPSSKQFRLAPKFTHPLIIQSELGQPCKDRADCSPMCLICNTPIHSLPSLSVEPWKSPVHKVCCDPCGFAPPGAAKGAVCKTMTLTVPNLFKETLGIALRCPAHCNHMTVRQGGHAEAGASKAAAEPPSATTVKTPRPTIPKPPPPRKPLKIERVKETGSHDIAKLLFPDRYAAKAKPEAKKARIEHHTPPSKGLGAAFLYGEKKFDFTEPTRIPLSDDLAHEKDEDKAGSGAGDGQGGSH